MRGRLMKAIVVEEVRPARRSRPSRLAGAAGRRSRRGPRRRPCRRPRLPGRARGGRTYQILPPLPLVPHRLAGTVAAVGPGVSRFEVGDRVMTQCENGAFAERVAVPLDRCFAVPAGLSLMKAAAMGLTYQTSWFGLFDRGQLKAGETVLVTGAGGGIGVASMQIAKAAGCRVLAGIGSPDKHDFVLEQGADAVIDMSGANLKERVREQVRAATGGEGADVVIENVAARSSRPASGRSPGRGGWSSSASPAAAPAQSRRTTC